MVETSAGMIEVQTPESFTRASARLFDGMCNTTVKDAGTNHTVTPCRALVARGKPPSLVVRHLRQSAVNDILTEIGENMSVSLG